MKQLNYRIGISPRINIKNLCGEKTTFLELSLNYLKSLEMENLIPIIIPLNHPDRIFPLCDGFLITGGDDIDPKFYNEENLASSGINNQIDLIDQEIITYAYNKNVPLLGICRGIQAIAVFLGGSLIQDLGLQNAFHHQNHFVTKIVNNKFTKLFPNKFLVNSHHHQAIKSLQGEFDIIFMANGIIEGISHQRKPIIGIQWHPERFNSPESDLIFKIFKEMVVKYYEQKSP